MTAGAVRAGSFHRTGPIQAIRAVDPGPPPAGGSYLDTRAADSVYECVEEINEPCQGGAFFEWIWTFVDVQPGALYLTFKGRSEGQRFQFMYKFSDPALPCPVHVYTLVPDTTLDTTTDRPNGITVRLLPWTPGGRLCLLLRRMGGARPVGEDFPAQVRMDFLKVTTDPLVSCARP
jgi:hypothetical protein